MTYIMQPYDDTLQYIIDNGAKKNNRTGVDTLSIFGVLLRFRIDDRFPILTKRKMFPKSIFAELLWMLSGSTNVNDLEALGSKIWSPWKDKKFEERNGYQDGELGPVYGWQLRHFDADYDHRFSHNVGFDQIEYVINELKNNPSSRRILFSYWNPVDMTSDRVKLPSCHIMFILNVTDGKLSGMLVQRSCDFCAGAPANIQFYSALLYMLAQQCNLKPFELVYSIADAHVYVDQIDAAKTYLSRQEVSSPKLDLSPAKDIFSYQLDNFKLNDYSPLEKIIFPVAV